MGLLQRIRRLWRLSGTPDVSIVSQWETTEPGAVTYTTTGDPGFFIPARPAIVVPDEPLDLFANEPENVEASEQTHTD